MQFMENIISMFTGICPTDLINEWVSQKPSYSNSFVEVHRHHNYFCLRVSKFACVQYDLMLISNNNTYSLA